MLTTTYPSVVQLSDNNRDSQLTYAATRSFLETAFKVWYIDTSSLATEQTEARFS